MKHIYFFTLLLLLAVDGFSNPYNKDSASYYLKIALDLKTAGRSSEADKSFQKAIRFDSTNENARVEYGNFLVDQRKFFPALEQYNKVLAQNSTNQAALQKLTEVHYMLNRWNDVVMYGQKLGQNNSFKNLNFMIGKSYYETENYGQAEKYLTQQVAADPTDTTAALLLGKVYIELDNYEKAIAVYNKALNANPDNSEIIYELGLLYKTIKKGREAVKYFELAQQKGYKEDLNFLENMGLAYITFDVKKGVEILNKVLEKKPGNPEILYQMAQGYYKAKMFQEAADTYRKAYVANPSNVQALYMSGNSYIMGGDKYRGTGICEEAIRLDPTLARLRNAKLDL